MLRLIVLRGVRVMFENLDNLFSILINIVYAQHKQIYNPSKKRHHFLVNASLYMYHTYQMWTYAKHSKLVSTTLLKTTMGSTFGTSGCVWPKCQKKQCTSDKFLMRPWSLHVILRNISCTCVICKFKCNQFVGFLMGI